jgi:Cu/Ag efflux pump CusA
VAHVGEKCGLIYRRLPGAAIAVEQPLQHVILQMRAGKERLAPMLMTGLTAGIGLIPLVLSPGEPGKEILYPVATVILGGPMSSTMLDFLVRSALFRAFGGPAAKRFKRDAEIT